MSFDDPAFPSDPRERECEPRLLTRRQPGAHDATHDPVTLAETLPPAEQPRANRRGRAVRRLGNALFVAFLAVFVLVLLGYAYERHAIRSAAVASLPQMDGSLVLPCLSGPVTVLRDAQGVPALRAGSLDDLAAAQGFITAGDRLFQMDLLRRHAAGDLAEVFGPSMLVHDRLQRTLLIRRAAENALAVLPADQLHLLEAYARGVNAAIEAQTREGRLPVEFQTLHYAPAQWTPRDSLLVSLAMFEDLTNTFPTKLAREALTARLPPELVTDLYPVGSWRDHPPSEPLPDLTVPGPPFEQVPLDESQAGLTLPSAPRMKDPCSDCRPGSNNWAVSGAHTASGKPLLSNDMHLNHGMPGIWYEVNLEAPMPAAEALHVAGVSLPGIPLVVVGHNRHIAWGFTVLGADVQDVYLETVRGAGSSQKFRTVDDTWQPVEHLAETIHVRGGKDLALDIAATRHGDTLTPILNPVLTPGTVAPRGQPARTLALRWSLYDPHAVNVPVLAVDLAHDWASFLAAFAGFGGPPQNLVYADDQGHIGYHAAGFVPLRGPATGEPVPALPAGIAADVDASPTQQTPSLRKTPDALAKTGLEAPAAPSAPLLSGELAAVPIVPSRAHEWTGYIPFDKLPQVFDPPGGIVATANARTAPDDYPYPITLNWAAPYRADRLYHALAHRTGLTPADMLALENDIYSDFDHVLAQRLAYAIDHAPSLTGKSLRDSDKATLRRAADLLRTFDGRMTTDSTAAAIVYATHAVLWPMLLEAKLGRGTTEAEANSLYLWGERDYALEQMLAHTPPRWLSAPYANWDDLLAAAVLRGLRESGAPSKLADWHYGQVHTVELQHPIFGQYPLLARLLGLRTGTGPQPQSGDTTTVKQVARTFGPSERFTADLGDPDRSTLNVVAGQSGDPASTNYLDQFPKWLRGSSYAFPFTHTAVDKSAVHTLTLTPRR